MLRNQGFHREMSGNRTTKNKCIAVTLLLCGLAVLTPAAASVGEMIPRDQDLPQKVVRLEEELHRALSQGDFDRVVELLPKAKRLESQLLEILEDSRRDAHAKEGLPLLLEIIVGLRRDVARLVADAVGDIDHTRK